MLRNEHKETLAKIRQELTLIDTQAKRISLQFQHLQREVELLKVELLQRLLEQKIESEARRRGVVSVMKDRKRLRSSMLVAAGGFILGGLLTQDKWAALNAGLSGLEGTLQGFGCARWIVLLGKPIIVRASESTPMEGKWLPWESLKLAMGELKKKALGGETLGNLDDVLHMLEQGVGIGDLPMSTFRLLS